MIDTWAKFLVALTRLIDGDDVSVSDVSNDTLTAIIAKTVALTVVALAAVLASRKPEVVPARRRK